MNVFADDVGFAFTCADIFDEKTVNFKERHVDMIKELSIRKKFFLFLL